MELKSDSKKVLHKELPKVNKLITIILVGLLLLIIFVPMGDESAGVTTSQSSYSEQGLTHEVGASYYEERLKVILEKSYGQGTMEVMVHMKEAKDSNGMYQESTLEVDGILIVADVDSATAVGDISFAVCALFDLPAHKVAVIKK